MSTHRVIPSIGTALGWHLRALRFGNDAEALEAKQTLAAAKIKYSVEKILSASPPLLPADVAELHRTLQAKGEATS